MSIKRKLKYLEETKQEIRKAIISRRVDVDKDATFRSYANKIRDIEIYDMYEGPYTLGPSTDTRVLQTNGFVMSDNITVETFPEYDGPYAVDPSAETQTLLTENKILTDDIVVSPVTVYDGSYIPYITSIEVTKQPNLIEYKDGDAINLAGLEVTAYYDNGKPYGIIPVQDITIDNQYARKTTNYAVTEVYMSGQDLLTMSSQHWNSLRSWKKENEGVAYFAVIRYKDSVAPFPYINCPLLIADNESAAWLLYKDPNDSTWNRPGYDINTKNGYYFSPQASIAGDINYIDTQVYGNFDTFNEGFDAVIADIEAGRYDPGKQTITVNWPRVGDGVILNTSFDIYISKKVVLNNE